MKNEKIIKICVQKFIYLNYSKRTQDNYMSHINIEMVSNENGVDAEQASTNMLERDFCTSVNNSIVEELIKYSKQK